MALRILMQVIKYYVFIKPWTQKKKNGDLKVMGLNRLRLSFAHPIGFWPIKAWGGNIKRVITTLAVVQSFKDSDQLAFPDQSIGTMAALGIDLFERDPPDGMGVEISQAELSNSQLELINFFSYRSIQWCHVWPPSSWSIQSNLTSVRLFGNQLPLQKASQLNSMLD